MCDIIVSYIILINISVTERLVTKRNKQKIVCLNVSYYEYKQKKSPNMNPCWGSGYLQKCVLLNTYY